VAEPERIVEPAPVVCASCGVVRSISAVTQQGTATGVGAALGAIVGGVAGNQVGGGSGQKIATVAGAIGGAVLGNNIEKNRSTNTYYEVTIDMEGGGQQFITVPDATGIAVGSSVEVQGSNIYLR
jgi:outer membrane lipoprotein SlyB